MLTATRYQRMEGSSPSKIQCLTYICLSMILQLSKSLRRNYFRKSTRIVSSRESQHQKAKWKPSDRAMCKTGRTIAWERKYISLMSVQSTRLNTYWPIHTVWSRSNQERWKSITKALAHTSALIYSWSISLYSYIQRQSRTSSRILRLYSLQSTSSLESIMNAWAW